jgi:hypothetical protein
MPRKKTTPAQNKTIGRVMHEFKHGELESGPGGKAGKVKKRKQAIAIALSEAGASKYETPAKNKRALARTKRKEARGETAQQQKEGKSHVGASGRRKKGR